MIRTRVGYAGGAQPDPTYSNIGDHTETIQIDYDPDLITYEQLLAIFWDSHNPTRQAYSVQYQSMILTQNEAQYRAATESRDQLQAELGASISTKIEPLHQFYLAEDYHQKYYLRGRSDLTEGLQAAYPEGIDWIDSTAAARLNAVAGGNLTLQALEVESAASMP